MLIMCNNCLSFVDLSDVKTTSYKIYGFNSRIYKKKKKTKKSLTGDARAASGLLREISPLLHWNCGRQTELLS